MPPTTTVRLKGQACLDFWNGLKKEEKTGEVLVADFEKGLLTQFGKHAEDWAIHLLVTFAVLEKPKLTVRVDEFDNFVRRFLPFEDCVTVAASTLLDQSTRSFYPWFHAFAKSEFASTDEKQFYIRLSGNSKPSPGQGESQVIPAHCLVLHYKNVKAGKANVAVRLISRQKVEGRYQYQPSSDDRGYDRFADLVKLRMTEPGYTPLASPIQGVTAATSKEAAAGMYHSALTITEKGEGKDATKPKCEYEKCTSPAVFLCEPCDIRYCEPCSKKDHSHGARVSHKFERLEE